MNEFPIYQPLVSKRSIHIVGCGATGSKVAIKLARKGYEGTLYLWDFDTVDFHNITNQEFLPTHVGKKKTDCLAEMLLAINPNMKLIKRGRWTPGEFGMAGIVLLLVDSIELRKEFYISSIGFNLDFVIDPRLGTATGDIFAYEWNEPNVNKLLGLSAFKDSEMEYEKSPCGTKINISCTVDLVSTYTVSILEAYLNKRSYPNEINLDARNFKVQFRTYK